MALAGQGATDAPSRPPSNKNADITFGIHKKGDGQLSMGNKVVRLDACRRTLTVDDTEYKLTLGLLVLISQKHPRAGQWNSNDYQVYKSLVAQTKVYSGYFRRKDAITLNDFR